MLTIRACQRLQDQRRPIAICLRWTPGAHAGDAATAQGFAAQLGFRLPNFVISPFTRRHYVSNIPMDHTAVIRFVEDRFIGNHQYLTSRDARPAQPAGLFRLQQHSLGHTACAAESGYVNVPGLRSLHSGIDGALETSTVS